MERKLGVQRRKASSYGGGVAVGVHFTDLGVNASLFLPPTAAKPKSNIHQSNTSRRKRLVISGVKRRELRFPGQAIDSIIAAPFHNHIAGGCKVCQPETTTTSQIGHD